MAVNYYTINYASTGNIGGKPNIKIFQADVDMSTSLILPGQGRINYGEFFDTNILQMLEHFADDTPPYSPTTGQIWYDTTSYNLRCYMSPTIIPNNLDPNSENHGWSYLMSMTGTTPTTPYAGQLVYVTNGDVINFWRAGLSTWETIASTKWVSDNFMLGSNTVLSNLVRKTGDTMTGPLILSENAAAPLEAVTLQQLNAAISTATNTLNSALNGISLFPVGGIIMWSGSISTIPSGWALCNGTNGTPDLRDRFVVGAGSTFAPGNTGGTASQGISFITDSHTLTVNEMPAHTHDYSFRSGGYNPWWQYANAATVSNTVTQATSSTGGGVGHSHTGSITLPKLLPPYYALAYIMKK